MQITRASLLTPSCNSARDTAADSSPTLSRHAIQQAEAPHQRLSSQSTSQEDIATIPIRTNTPEKDVEIQLKANKKELKRLINDISANLNLTAQALLSGSTPALELEHTLLSKSLVIAQKRHTSIKLKLRDFDSETSYEKFGDSEVVPTIKDKEPSKVLISNESWREAVSSKDASRMIDLLAKGYCPDADELNAVYATRKTIFVGGFDRMTAIAKRSLVVTAIEEGDFEIADKLVALGATLPTDFFNKINLPSSSLSEFFKIAIHNRVVFYLALKKFPFFINIQDENGDTVFHHIANEIETKNSDFNDTEIYFPSYGNQPAKSKWEFAFLLEHAAEWDYDFSLLGQRGETVLHILLQKNPKLVSALVNPQPKVQHSDRAPLLFPPFASLEAFEDAIFASHIPMQQADTSSYDETAIFPTAACKCLDTLSAEGASVLYCAIHAEKFRLAMALLEAGADPTVGNNQKIPLLLVESKLEKLKSQITLFKNRERSQADAIPKNNLGVIDYNRIDVMMSEPDFESWESPMVESFISGIFTLPGINREIQELEKLQRMMEDRIKKGIEKNRSES